MPTTPTTYAKGHLKHDPATNSVAIRTMFPEDQGPQLAGMAWLIATADSGARHSDTAGVESWADLYTPVPETPPTP